MSDETALMVTDQAELSVSEVHGQVQKIQQLMKSVMREGEHYGVIPGTDKPTLYKAGAEKLCFTFRLVPEFDLERRDLPDGHREYEVVCTLRHLQSGKVVGQGVGCCSTMESKYRYRDSVQSTGKPVPGQYWNLRQKNPGAAQTLLGGPGFKARKIDGVYMIVRSGGKAENPDIADCYNTVLKMALKRSHVGATLTATAASDIFTQDLEDIVEQEETGFSPKTQKKGQNRAKTSGKGSKTGEKARIKDPIRQDLINEIGGIMTCGLFSDKERAHIRELVQGAGTNDKLVKIKQGCRQEADKRKAKRQEEESGGEDPELERIANDGWDAGDKKTESGGEETSEPPPEPEFDVS